MLASQRHIGIVMPLASQRGGAETLLMHLLRNGSERYTISCAFLQSGPLVEETRSLGYQTCVIETTRLTDPANYLKSITALRGWVQSSRLSAVLSWMPKAHLYVAPATAFVGVKRMWFQHGISHGGKMDRITTVLAADRILCCSEASKAAQQRIAPQRPTFVCYPGVPDPQPCSQSPTEIRAALGLPPGRLIGMVARWERWKGVHVFIEAARLVAAVHPDTQFFVVGGPHPRDPGYAEEIRALVKNTSLGNRLILSGQRAPEEVPLWQAAADIMVHPVTGEEPFGMAVVEAMRLGKVVVASDAGGLREIIEEGVSGYLVPKGDPEALAAKLNLLLRQGGLPVTMQTAAHSRSLRFSVSGFAHRLEEIIASTISPEGLTP